MGLYWLSTEARTGRVIADLPNLDVGLVKAVIGRYDTTTATLPLPGAPVDWERATQPGAAVLWLLADNPNDSAHGIPLWGGRVTARDLSADDTIGLSLATVESYFDARYVGDVTFAQIGQNTIISNLVASYAVAGSPNGGMPFRVVTSGTDTLRDRTYQNQNNTTLYSVMQDLMGVIGGCEWTTGGEWQVSPERITPVLYVGSRLGSPVLTGQAPNAVFDMPGPVTQFKYRQDFSTGKGANLVVASSSGTTAARPQSAPQTVVDLARPTIEYRWTPSTSISDVTTLNSYASAAVAAMDFGTNAIELTAVIAEAPKLGVDWFIGDDIGFNLVAPALPNGLVGTARAIGWQIDISTTPVITPILTGNV